MRIFLAEKKTLKNKKKIKKMKIETKIKRKWLTFTQVKPKVDVGTAPKAASSHLPHTLLLLQQRKT